MKQIIQALVALAVLGGIFALALLDARRDERRNATGPGSHPGTGGHEHSRVQLRSDRPS